jgi:hypothetical protein
VQIAKTVADFIPRRVIPSHMLYEKRSQKADEEYRTQIQDIVRSLVKEFQACISTDPGMGAEEKFDADNAVGSKSSEDADKVMKILSKLV